MHNHSPVVPSKIISTCYGFFISDSASDELHWKPKTLNGVSVQGLSQQFRLLAVWIVAIEYLYTNKNREAPRIQDIFQGIVNHRKNRAFLFRRAQNRPLGTPTLEINPNRERREQPQAVIVRYVQEVKDAINAFNARLA